VIKAARTPKEAAAAKDKATAAPATALPQRQRKKPAAKAAAAKATPPAKGKGKATPQKKKPVKKQNLAKAVTAKASATRQVSIGVHRSSHWSVHIRWEQMRDGACDGFPLRRRQQCVGRRAKIQSFVAVGDVASDENRVGGVSH
jgi:hypothetical protein